MTQDEKTVTTYDLIKPEFKKLEFTISPHPVFEEKGGKVIDFANRNIKAEDIDTKMVLKVGQFKTFYDNLLKGFTEHDKSINSNYDNVESSLTSIITSIGNQTQEINDIIENLRKDMPYFSPTQAEDIL